MPPLLRNVASRDGLLRNRLLLSLTMFTTGVSQSIVFVALPALSGVSSLTPLQIGLIGGVPAIAFVVSAPILGAWVTPGREMIFIRAGLLQGVMTNTMFALAIHFFVRGSVTGTTTFYVLLCFRCLLNLAWGGMFPAVQASMAQKTGAGQRISGMAWILGSNGLGLVAGPLIPAMLLRFEDGASFHAAAALTALPLALSLMLPNDANPAAAARPNQQAHAGRMALVAKSADFLMIAFFLMSALTLVQQLAGFQTRRAFGLSHAESVAASSRLLATSAFAMLAAQWSIASGRFRLNPFLGLAWCSAAGVLSIALLIVGYSQTSFSALHIGYAIFGFAMGIAIPSNVGALSLSFDNSVQGQIAGLNGSAQGFGRTIGPIIGTSMLGLPAVSAYLVGIFFFVVICTIATLRYRRRD